MTIEEKYISKLELKILWNWNLQLKYFNEEQR